MKALVGGTPARTKAIADADALIALAKTYGYNDALIAAEARAKALGDWAAKHVPRAMPVVQRVALSRESQAYRHMGRSTQRVETQYLDGGREVRTAGISEETDVPDAVSSRTTNIADFGRIRIATEKLAQQMRDYDTENLPSDLQLATFIRSYQNILRWRDAVQVQMDTAAGQIEAVEGMLERWLD